MHRLPKVLVIVLLVSLSAIPTAAQQPAETTVRAETNLVNVDVIVTDKKGNPIRGLTKQDFTILDENKPQSIAFETFIETTAVSSQQPKMELPPDTFTNVPEYTTSSGPLTVLLLDALNTPVLDQLQARKQVIDYLKKQEPGTRTAVMALGRRLFVLQDFTTDPKLLQAALEKAEVAKPTLIDDQATNVQIPLNEVYQTASTARATSMDQASIGQFQALSGALQSFINRTEASQTDVRVGQTLSAMQSIARFTRGYPGRKNLIWVSAAFPISFLPDDIENMRNYSAQIRETAAKLTDAQVAVYPVDARGLIATVPDIRTGSTEFTRISSNPAAARSVETAAMRVRNPQESMDQVADQTGGRAYFNRNDIDRAVALAVSDGSTYYTLGYYPKHDKWDGKFRHLKVKVNRPDVEVRHRQGYFAVQPARAEGKTREEEMAYALTRDPVLATGVLFGATLQEREGEQLPVQFLVDGKSIIFQPSTQQPGKQACQLNFYAAVIAADGKTVKTAGKSINAALSQPDYERVRQGVLPFRLMVEVPKGDYLLRLGVQDLIGGRIGTVNAFVRTATTATANTNK